MRPRRPPVVSIFLAVAYKIVVFTAGSVSSQVKYYRDTYAEHPEDRENIEYGVRLRDDQSLVTLTGLYDQMRELGYDLRYARCELVSMF